MGLEGHFIGIDLVDDEFFALAIDAVADESFVSGLVADDMTVVAEQFLDLVGGFETRRNLGD